MAGVELALFEILAVGGLALVDMFLVLADFDEVVFVEGALVVNAIIDLHASKITITMSYWDIN